MVRSWASTAVTRSCTFSVHFLICFLIVVIVVVAMRRSTLESGLLSSTTYLMVLHCIVSTTPIQFEHTSPNRRLFPSQNRLPLLRIQGWWLAVVITVMCIFLIGNRVNCLRRCIIQALASPNHLLYVLSCHASVQALLPVCPALQVRDADGRCIIASASPATGRKQVNIKVWAHIYNPHAKPSTPNTLSSSKSIWTTIKLLILLALLSFGVQSSFVHSVSTFFSFHSFPECFVQNEIVHLVMNIVPIARWCSLVQERALVDVNHALPSDVKKTGLKSEMPTRNKYESDIEEQNTRSLEELAQQIMHLGWVANPRIFETTETDADSTSNNVIYL